MKDVVVVGAGISGLTLAYYLQQAGLSVQVLESSSRVGGVIRSETVKSGLSDYRLNWGPQTLVASEELLELLRDLAIDEDIIYPSVIAKKRFIAQNRLSAEGSRLVPVPMKPQEFVFSPFLSPLGKLRLLLEPLFKDSPHNFQDETVFSFIGRHFGEEASFRLASAMLSGIWAGDINQLSARSTLPGMWELSSQNRSLLLALLDKAKQVSARKIKGSIFTLSSGLESLPKALAEKISLSVISLNCTVEGIEYLPDNQGVKVWCSKSDLASSSDCHTAKLICFATPAETTAKLLQPLAPELSASISQIPYAPLGLLHLLYDAGSIRHPLDGFGFLVPTYKKSGTKKVVLGAIFQSSLFPEVFVPGKKLISCFIGGMSNPNLARVDSEPVQQQAIKELFELIDNQSPPEVLGHMYHPRAIPNYTIGHFHTAQAVQAFHQQQKNIRLLGNWFGGVSIGDRISQSKKLAKEIRGTVHGND